MHIIDYRAVAAGYTAAPGFALPVGPVNLAAAHSGRIDTPFMTVPSGFPATLSLAFHRASAVLNTSMQAVLREHGLTLTHWRVLAFLAEHGERSVSALAAETGHDQTTLSRALTVMEAAHWVERRATVRDHRVVAIHLLKDGRKLFRKAMPLVADLEAMAFDGLTAKDHAVLGSALAGIQRNLDPR
jgi:DNA-binding MarR family transcriptional regulator